MNCEHYQTLFFDYERDTLNAKQRQELTAHLQGCEHCSTMLASLQQVSTLLDTQHEPSPLLAARFRERLQREAPLIAPRSVAAVSEPASAWGFVQQLWRKYWPSQPLGSFGYSLALLVIGVMGGQYLPARTFGFGADASVAEQHMSRERLIQLCAVPPQPVATLF